MLVDYSSMCRKYTCEKQLTMIVCEIHSGEPVVSNEVEILEVNLSLSL